MIAGSADGDANGQRVVCGDGDFGDFFHDPQSPDVSFTAGANGSLSQVLMGRGGSGSGSAKGSLRSRSSSSAAVLQGDAWGDISGCSVLDGPAPRETGLSSSSPSAAAAGADADAGGNNNNLRRNKDRRMPSLIAAFAADRSVGESDRSSSPLSSPSQGRQGFLGSLLPASGGLPSIALNGAGAGVAVETPPSIRIRSVGSRMQADGFALGSTSAAVASSSSSSPMDINSPGFGEAVERFSLPSETGSHDRLQRLSPETMIQLLNGGFDEVVSNYTIIDCRYTYEYAGGHIPGAVNLRTVEEIKDYLLTPRSGLHLDSDILPPRTTAGRVGAGDKHVLIFHCEYSQKRAPRMAAALRDIDRSLAQDWPRCHYPELYILQGGYERFYKQYPAICQPRQYVGEKDPRYEMEWKAESRTFNREFTRHKSMPVPRKLQRRMSESAAGMMLCGGAVVEEQQEREGDDGRRVSAMLPRGAGGFGLGDVSGSGSGTGDDSHTSASDDTPSRPPLLRMIGQSKSAVLGSSSLSKHKSDGPPSSGDASSSAAGLLPPLSNRTNLLAAPAVGAPRFGTRQPGMGPRAATASYVPMLCSAGSAMIREASREGDHSFSP